MAKRNVVLECEKMMADALTRKDAAALKDLLGKAVLFRDFSPRNSILIAQQCPEASVVMGKKAWERFGARPRNDGITITGMKREIRGDRDTRVKWLEKNPFRKTDIPELLPARLKALREGTSPTSEELELAEQNMKGFRKEYDDWLASKPKNVFFNTYYIPVKVYDISQCEIVDEEKFKALPRPKMRTKEDASKLYEKIRRMLEEKGFDVYGLAPQVVGRAVKNVLLIDGEAEEDEKLFQLLQAWANTKTQNFAECVMSAAMFMLHSGYSDSISEEVLETVFLKVRSQRELSSAITKAGNTFRDMFSEFEQYAIKEIEEEKESVLKEMELDCER